MGLANSVDYGECYFEEYYCPFQQIISEGVGPKVRLEAPTSFTEDYLESRSKNYQCSIKSGHTTSSEAAIHQLEHGVENYPACAVGYLQSWFGGSIYSFGSAFLVQKNIVMTCAHLLYSQDTKQLAKEITFYPARSKDQGKKIMAVGVYCPKEYAEAKDSRTAFLWDFGVIIFQEDLHEQFGYLGVSFDDSDIGGSQPKTLYGYPSNNQEIQMCIYQGECRLQQNFIKHNFPTIKGMDGGPILYQKGNRSVVVGIHQGNYFQGRALKLRTEMYQYLISWLGEYRGGLKLKGKCPQAQAKNILKKYQKKKIAEIDLSFNSLAGETILHLVNCNWNGLMKLNVGQNNLGNEGLKFLCKGKWPRLLQLNLHCNYIQKAGIQHLQQANWPLLEILDLRQNLLQNESVKVLFSCSWPKLSNLKLQRCQLGSEGIYWLTKVDWKKLKELNLAKNQIGDDGVNQLFDSNWYWLQSLNVDENKIGNAGIKALAKMHWKNMKTFSAKYNLITGEGLASLCNSDWKKLSSVDCRWNSISEPQSQLLRKAFKGCFPRLKSFYS